MVAGGSGPAPAPRGLQAASRFSAAAAVSTTPDAAKYGAVVHDAPHASTTGLPLTTPLPASLLPSFLQAQRAIREVDGKRFLSQWLPKAWEEVCGGADAAPLAGFSENKAFGVQAKGETGAVDWDALLLAYVLVTKNDDHRSFVCRLSCGSRGAQGGEGGGGASPLGNRWDWTHWVFFSNGWKGGLGCRQGFPLLVPRGSAACAARVPFASLPSTTICCRMRVLGCLPLTWAPWVVLGVRIPVWGFWQS
jgi:hypothetical protein